MARMHMLAATLLLAAGATCTEVDIWLTKVIPDADLDAALMRVSTPTHADYGKYLSASDLAALVGHSPATIASLSKWLEGRSLRHTVSATRDKITIHGESDLKREHFPSHLAASVAKVVRRTPPSPGSRASRHTTPSPLLGATGSAEVRKAYGIPDSNTGSGVDQLVWGPGTYGVLTSDVTKYWSTYGIANTSLDRLKLEGYAGEQKSGDNFGEASLDTDIITGMAPGAVTHVSNTNNSEAPEEGPGFGYAQAAFFNQLAAETAPAEVLSLSLGSLTFKSCDILCKTVAAAGTATYADCLKEIQYNERQVCMFTNDFVIQQANTELMKLGLRGVTVVAASGDGGMHFSFKPFSEFTTMGRALNKAACAYTMPTFPASSPYVTAIGGTAWSSVSHPASSAEPVYWNGGGSGFSWDFPMPDYQKEVVEAYLSEHGSDDSFPPSSAFNKSCRAYPDVSALGSGNAMCSGGRCFGAGGTSASAPTFGGVVTLLNSQLKAAGRPVLGFLNPALYTAAASHSGEMFYDVTLGNSKCSSESCLTCSTGFPATKGFDLATGWGAPRWAGLSKYLGQ